MPKPRLVYHPGLRRPFRSHEMPKPRLVYHPGRWAFNSMTGAIIHLRAAEREVGMALRTDKDFDLIIPETEVPSLLAFLQENTMLKVKAESREEDLKIVHRLMDLLGAPRSAK